MTEVTEHIRQLLIKQLQGELTQDEQTELQAWSENNIARQQLINKLANADYISKGVAALYGYDNSSIAVTLQQRFPQFSLPETAQPLTEKPARRIHFLKTTWFRYAAAILLIFGIGTYIYLTHQKEHSPIATSKPVPAKNDIQPGGNRAILTLADGSSIILDSVGTGQLASQEGAVIKKYTQGEVIYNAQGKADKVMYNTMSTPRGGQYRLTLSDGTKVWLNAGSSITYPTVFTGDKREVNIEGEVYFEVKSNPKNPFIVKTPRDEVSVLGTSFNLNAYREDRSVKYSLAKGVIKVNDQLLKPGEAFWNGKVIQTTIEQDIAWKNGYFNLNGLDLQTVMSELSRWYDINVLYENGVPDLSFVGKMERSLTLAQLLKGLDAMGLEFNIQERNLIVKNKKQ